MKSAPPHMGTASPPSGGEAGPNGGVRKALSASHLVGLTFFAVCGGDYGIEDAVGAAGPAWTLAGLLVVPWLWSLPIALMTAELGAMIPDVGGPVIWVDRAFGSFVAHQNALVHLVANFFDNALYPVMFADYLREFHPALQLEGLPRYLLCASMLACVAVLNLLGVDAVASVSVLFTVLVISPFAALVVIGLPAVDPGAWLLGSSTPGGPRWVTFLSILLWNTSGYDSVGALAGEVENPGRDFPRAMVASIVLISLVYILPVAVGVSLVEPSTLGTWTDGTFALVAKEHVGEWLARWISLGRPLISVSTLLLTHLTHLTHLTPLTHLIHAPSSIEHRRSTTIT